MIVRAFLQHFFGFEGTLSGPLRAFVLISAIFIGVLIKGFKMLDGYLWL